MLKVKVDLLKVNILSKPLFLLKFFGSSSYYKYKINV